MSLVTEVQARYPDELLRQLTNPYAPAETAHNATKLAQAATAVEAWFKIYAQTTLDTTDAAHLDVACDGVIMCLQKWGGAAAGVATITRDAWVESCKALRGIGARSRIVPDTNSPDVPAETLPSPPDEPAFSDRMFDPLIPGRSANNSSDMQDRS